MKRLELLHETLPAAKRIGLLIDPAVLSTRHQLREAARKLDLVLIEVDAPNPKALADAFDALASAHLDAVNVLASPFFSTGAARQVIIERLNQARLPAMIPWPAFTCDGCSTVPKASACSWNNCLRAVLHYSGICTRSECEGHRDVIFCVPRSQAVMRIGAARWDMPQATGSIPKLQ